MTDTNKGEQMTNINGGGQMTPLGGTPLKKEPTQSSTPLSNSKNNRLVQSLLLGNYIVSNPPVFWTPTVVGEGPM